MPLDPAIHQLPASATASAAGGTVATALRSAAATGGDAGRISAARHRHSDDAQVKPTSSPAATRCAGLPGSVKQ